MVFSHRKTVAHLVALAVLLSFWCGVSSGMTLTAGVGLPAPDLSLDTLDGQTVNLSLLKGGNVLLLFGATWCPHCRTALGILEDICESAGDDLIVFFVPVGQSADELNDYFGDAIPPYLILLDESSELGRRFGIKRIPVCTFIDEAGVILHKGRFDQTIVRRLLSGERLTYPDRPPDHLKLRDRLTRKSDTPSASKRYFVELDEEPGLAKKLPKAAIDAKRTQFRQAAEWIGGRVIHDYGKLKNRIVVEISPDKADRLRQMPRFKKFTEDRRVHALLEDSVYQIRADYAWDNAITGQGVKVCVVDTGIDPTHPDLLSKVIAQIDVTTGTQDAMDDNGHGTHCAGIIASEGTQYRGVSHDVSLLAAKVLDYSGSGYASDVILGINWCVEQEADVISLSLGEGLYSGNCDTDELAQAVNAAVDAGVVVACAAGNDGDLSRMVSPACASKVIAVGAVDKVDSITSYSDGGSELDLVAPGGEEMGGKNFPEIVSAYSTEVAENPLYCMYQIDEECYDEYFLVDGSRYIRAVGTSMAAPHVAAAAALLLEENPSLSPAQVKTVLEQNADDLGDAGWDATFGWGRINIEKALDNIPPETAELMVEITEPNASDQFTVNEQFALTAKVDCYGGDGCGQVLVHAKFCEGRDCNDFVDMNALTTFSTLDNNPNSLGILSGYTVEMDVNVVFDAQTVLDISQNSYTKSIDPLSSLVGSTMQVQYNSGDLEPRDGVGAIGEDAQEHYPFEMPAGAAKILKVRMENYIVLHAVYPPFAGWYVYTSNAAGDNLHLVGDCIPAEGGGGETPSPDCWFISDDPDVLADLNPGGTSYIKLVSHDVEDDGIGQDWLTFNDIEVIVEYEPDPDNDEVYEYYVQFDLADVNAANELTAARLKISVAQGAPQAVAEVYVVDAALTAADPAQAIHEANDVNFPGLVNPIKTFSGEGTGTISLNVKTAVEEALAAGQSTVAFQISERDNDQLFAVGATGGENAPTLTISQKVLAGSGQEPPEQGSDPNNGPRFLVYDSMVVRDVNDDTYTKYDSPAQAVIGAEFASEYSTGDLEDQDGIGAIGEDAQEHYQFDIPEGIVKTLKVRMENYIVTHWVYPPYAGWYVYTSNADGDNLHLVGDCVPAEGGGGETPSPDCWFISDDVDVLADLTPGGTNYIKLVSHDVEDDGFGQDWLTFNDIEVIVEYGIDPNKDNISRYYVKFDVSELPADSKVDSASLNVYVADPNSDAVGQINLVDGALGPANSGYEIYAVEDAGYSSIANPLKTFAADSTGARQINVKAALEDAIENEVGQIAFLITEEGEDSLFTIDANDGANPPRLDVYLKSDLTGGLATWHILPGNYGDYRLRVLAENDVGATGLSDTVVVIIYDPNLPVVNSVECMIDSVWQDCRNTQYGDTIQEIRVDATDPQETPDVRLTVRNVPDDHNFVDEQLIYSAGYFSHETNLEVVDSGQWQIKAVAADSDGNTDTEIVTWNIPWGRLTSSLISPTTDIIVPKSSSFSVRTSTQCHDAECPQAKGSILLNKPVQLKYDDATAEDFGQIGDAESLVAIELTPESYPAQLKTARFYIWDTTTYPFELHVWDDDGYLGAPNTELIVPFIVDPVVPSTPDVSVAWFDIDLSAHNVVIDSGSFYIGWRQIVGTQNNQVGFDMNGYVGKRTWGYLELLGGWFKFEDWEWLLPDLEGNIMIRAIMGEPGGYEGVLPATVGPAPFYTLDDHPYPCPDMDAGDTCNVEFQVSAVGAVGRKAKFYASAEAAYSYAFSESVQVTITDPQTPCDAANLNAVYPVDYRDFAVLANQWHQTPDVLIADINGDGNIDFKDVAQLADYWLSACQ